MKTLFLSCWLSLLGCREPPTSTADLSIAPTEYLVLAQKALTCQADFDTLTWAGLLADRVEYQLAGQPAGWRGKAAVLVGWKHWQHRAGIQTIRLSGLTHLPVQTLHPLPLMGRAGVYVVSYCQAHVRYADGHQTSRPIHLCYHFDADKRIDAGWLFMPDPAQDTLLLPINNP
ncbi:hypothetical protein GCM10023187_04940 [Nibrella viscosa]|uniref:Ketosteroid isomerase homolog n=1 Tax=Nibrella viscosa TaxID=1084524 RepID=A0ABP8JVE7_9BACT